MTHALEEIVSNRFSNDNLKAQSFLSSTQNVLMDSSQCPLSENVAYLCEITNDHFVRSIRSGLERKKCLKWESCHLGNGR